MLVSSLVSEIAQTSRQWQYSKTVTLCQELLDHAPPDSINQTERLYALRESSSALWQLGQPESAWQQLQQYQQEAGEQSEHTVQALCRMAHILIRRGKLDDASDKLDLAMQIAVRLKDELGMSVVYHQRGRLAAFQGYPESALIEYKKARTIYVKTTAALPHCDLWTDIGRAHQAVGRIDKAIEAFQSALKLAHHLNHPKICLVLNHLGECYRDLYDMEQAKSYHLQALDHLAELSQTNKTFHHIKADVYRNLGVAYYYLGDMRAGRAALQKTLFLLDEQDSLEIRLKTLFTLSRLDLDQGDLTMALQRACELRDEAKANEIHGLHAWALFLLGLCFEREGSLEEAQTVWQRGLFLAHDTEQRMLLWRIHAALARTASSEALGRVHYQIAGEAIHQIIAPIESGALQSKFKQASEVAEVLENCKQVELYSQRMRRRFGV